ncbi:MAG: EAL domain-containing protein [Gammaproteobacteria bacterium]|nr:EAL domain-containing protein [Gammaproteobacteria bacterium]
MKNSQLTLEVTETAALEDPARTLDILTRLRVKNIGLSLDDFGTGYSSLTQLYQMPFNEIKIDKSLGMEIQSSREARAIVRSLVDLAHNLELKVCCEGVETLAALEFLQSVGCDFAQGYHIGRPMPAEQLTELARSWNEAVLAMLDADVSTGGEKSPPAGPCLPRVLHLRRALKPFGASRPLNARHERV